MLVSSPLLMVRDEATDDAREREDEDEENGFRLSLEKERRLLLLRPEPVMASSGLRS